MPRLMLGVCAYLLALPFLPPGIMAMALTLLTAAFICTPGPTDPDPGFAFLLPVLPFLAATLLALARSPDPGIASAVLSFYLPGLVLFIMMLRRPDWPMRHWMVAYTLFAAALCLAVVAGWVQVRLGAKLPLTMETAEGALRYSHQWLLVVPNDISAAAILLAFPLALLADTETPRALRGLAIVTIGLTALALAILRTRTGVMVAAAELLVVGIVWPRALLWAVPAGLVLVAGDQWVGSHTLEKLIYANNLDNHGVAGRLGLWASAWGMFLDAPLLGHGAQSFGHQHASYMPDWAPRFPERHVMWAHSLYLETMAEQGMLGTAALAFLLLQPLGRLCHMIVKLRRSVDRRTVSVFALAGLTGFIVAAGFELSFIRRWVAVVLFGLLGFAARTHWHGVAGHKCAIGRLNNT